MEAKITWKGGLSFDGTAESGFTVPLGTVPEVGGADDGFRPLELMAISLIGCTGMDVNSILMKKREEVTDFNVETHIQRAEKHPKVFTGAVIDFHVTGHDVSEDALLRSIELLGAAVQQSHQPPDDLLPFDGQPALLVQQRELLT